MPYDKLIEISRSFRAMNTDVEAVVCLEEKDREPGERALDKTQDTFVRVEKTLNRFDPASELSRLNTRSGSRIKVSHLTFQVIDAALKAAHDSDGVFDPTMLHSLMRAGYTKSFEKLPFQDEPADFSCPSHKPSWKDIYIDAALHTIFMPEGTGIDLGGIGKGWTVDLARSMLQRFPGYAIDAGGDIVAGGKRPDGSPWTIGVADPFNTDRDLMVLELTGGAICTSSTLRRRWQAGNGWAHHIIDPRTGLPSDSDVVSATVLAGTAARAETVAKVALVLGSRKGMAFIDERTDTRGLLVMKDGIILRSARFQELANVA